MKIQVEPHHQKQTSNNKGTDRLTICNLTPQFKYQDPTHPRDDDM